MAGDAADALGEMDGVVEKDVVGEAGDAVPGERFSGRCAVHDGPEHGGVGEEPGVAVEAGPRGGHAGEGGGLDGVVAVAAIDAELAGVVAVAEEDGLLGRVADTRPVGGVVVLPDGEGGGGDREDEPDETNAHESRGRGAKERPAAVGRWRSCGGIGRHASVDCGGKGGEAAAALAVNVAVSRGECGSGRGGGVSCHFPIIGW